MDLPHIDKAKKKKKKKPCCFPLRDKNIACTHRKQEFSRQRCQL